MKKFIIHLKKFMGRNRFIHKRLEIYSTDLITAYNKSIKLNPDFEVSMIWPEYP